MSFQTTPALERAVGDVLARYSDAPRSALLPVLQAVQAHAGFVSDEAAVWVAGRLKLDPVAVLEVLSFYPGLWRHPVGRHIIRVCRTLSCDMAGGGRPLRRHILKRLGLEEPPDGRVVTTPDGRITVEFAECLASCSTGPNLMIDEELHEGVTPEKADELIGKLA